MGERGVGRRGGAVGSLVVWTILLGLAGAGAAGAEEYYTEPAVFDLRPGVKGEMALDCIGTTGIQARFYPGVVLKVEGVIEGSPAAGKFTVGQIIRGVNGVKLQGVNPYVALGEALTRAEASDGVMAFEVQDDEKAAQPGTRTVTVNIPVLGAYSETWPMNCEKSRRIIAQAAEYYAHDPAFRRMYFNDNSENGGIPSALACLFLLSTGDDRYLPIVRDYFAGFPKDVKQIGDHTWNNGYNGIACAEYFLRSGDKEVLPILQYYCDNARERQHFGVGWGHWGRSINPNYVAGGLMNPAGAQVLTTLLLAKECGVKVDEQTLLGALKYWYRFVGHGSVPYGDHRSEGGIGSNGKDGMAAAAMRVAMEAKGRPAIYEQALKSLSMATLDSYPALVRGHGDEGRGDGIWRGIASAYMLDYKPQAYHATMNRLTWWYDLSRRPSGALGLAACQRFDDEGSGAGAALAYTAPLKTLRITGAPRSKHAVDFELPTHLWGNDADLVFHSIEHARRFQSFGDEPPIHVIYHTLGNAYRDPEHSGVPREMMVQNLHHRHYMVRAQAAKALVKSGRLEDVTPLLRDEDPRLRRAALDGIIDYRYWFHIGKAPIKPEQFTPDMIAAIVQILRDPDEALYVIDGGLSAMSLMSPQTVGEHLDLVMPWSEHEEWWLRQSAFAALARAATDETLAPRVLPTMMTMLNHERHTMPRQSMVGRLNGLLKQYPPSTALGQQILAAHLKAAQERPILPSPRSGEGEYDVSESFAVVLRESPQNSLALARIIEARMTQMSTGSLTAMIRSLLGAMDKVPPGDRPAVEALVFGPCRAELIERLKRNRQDLTLIDTIVALCSSQSPPVGWRPLGSEPLADRKWRYVTFEPQGSEAMHPREKKRFRQVTPSPENKDWFLPEFDDSAWLTGQAPIGRGVFKRRPSPYENRSPWGQGEFVFMRTSFELEAVDDDFYRVCVLAKQGYDIYLNGTRIHRYVWWNDTPEYRRILLDPQQVKLLRKGVNHLAVLAGGEYFEGEFVGQIDVYLEGLSLKDILGTP